jgi:hypothetical protein
VDDPLLEYVALYFQLHGCLILDRYLSDFPKRAPLYDAQTVPYHFAGDVTVRVHGQATLQEVLLLAALVCPNVGIKVPLPLNV